MHLVVDVGNTRIKLAVFSPEVLVYQTAVFNEELEKSLDIITANYSQIDYGIISSVGNLKEAQLKKITSICTFHYLGGDSIIPFKNAYKTPHTLGVDRIALVSGAVKHYPEKNVLVIDAGSCVTYDFIDAQGIYHGGAISPGLNMRFEALHTFTAKLPFIHQTGSEDFIGEDTQASMQSGVENGIVYEIDGFINKYREKFTDLTVILTGGDLQFLSKRLKNTIFANSKLLLEGLNHILVYNKHE